MTDESSPVSEATMATATHTNYNTGEPCFCDAPFDYLPGPCMDAEPPTDGTDPANGSG